MTTQMNTNSIWLSLDQENCLKQMRMLVTNEYLSSEVIKQTSTKDKKKKKNQNNLNKSPWMCTEDIKQGRVFTCLGIGVC